jgi:hypothetical protein
MGQGKGRKKMKTKKTGEGGREGKRVVCMLPADVIR